LIVNECFVYKIPPRTSADGYKAKDWNITNFIWSGKLVIRSKGDSCVIRLEDPNTGELFAVCPVNTTGPQAVEPVLDSSRYFVLRIEDGKGHHAFIGMGFTERTDAFDFNVALQEHAKEVKRRTELAEGRLHPEPAKDYSLKQGETIKVHLKAKTKKKDPSQSRAVPQEGGLLPPPPSSAGPGGAGSKTKKGATTPQGGQGEWSAF